MFSRRLTFLFCQWASLEHLCKCTFRMMDQLLILYRLNHQRAYRRGKDSLQTQLDCATKIVLKGKRKFRIKVKN